MSDSEEERECPPCPAPFIRLPADTRPVLDADEEIFELYMTVEPDDKGGLGYISKSGELPVMLELEPPVTAKMEQLSLGAAPPAASGSGGSGGDTEPDPTPPSGGKKTKRAGHRAGRTRTARKDKAHRSEAVSLELLVHQDPSGLHSRSGETGTVLWRSSLGLAENTLKTLLFEPPGWLDWKDVGVLELGAGVGLLAVTLGAVAQQWTATDYLNENLKLVKRNCAENANVRSEIARLVGRSHAQASEEAEWDDDDGKGKKGRRRTTDKLAGAAVAMPTLTQLDWTHVAAQREKGKAEVPKSELVLAVDCLYNEHLVKPLVDTLATACQAGAVAFIVVELRSSDVLSLFLSTLLADPADFTVVRLPRSAMGEWAAAAGGRARWVGWVAWCPSSSGPGTSCASGSAGVPSGPSGASNTHAQGAALDAGSSNASQEAQEGSGSARSAAAAGTAATAPPPGREG